VNYFPIPGGVAEEKAKMRTLGRRWHALPRDSVGRRLSKYCICQRAEYLPVMIGGRNLFALNGKVACNTRASKSTALAAVKPLEFMSSLHSDYKIPLGKVHLTCLWWNLAAR
jgi:hypothetical protein